MDDSRVQYRYLLIACNSQRIRRCEVLPSDSFSAGVPKMDPIDNDAFLGLILKQDFEAFDLPSKTFHQGATGHKKARTFLPLTAIVKNYSENDPRTARAKLPKINVGL